MHRTILLGLVGLAGCNLVGLGETRETWEDAGYACLGTGTDATWATTGTETITLEADTEVSVVAVISTCVSGSFDFQVLECEATAEAGVVTVTSLAEVVIPNEQTDDCRWVAVECDPVVLDAGDWTLAYGSQELDLAIPYDGDAPCTDPQ